MLARSMILGLAWGALALVSPRTLDLPEQRLPIWGGSGGTAFSRSCGTGRVLSGVRYRKGIWIDALGLLCRPVNADGSLGAETVVGTLAGGGGSPGIAQCPSGTVGGGASIGYGDIVTGLRVQCYMWQKDTRSLGAAVGSAVVKDGGRSLTNEKCATPAQPVVAMRGRAGLFIDAVGFTCDEP